MKCLREKGQGPRIDQYFLRSQSSQSNEIQRQEANHSSQDISTPVIDVRRTCMDTVSDEPNDPCEPGPVVYVLDLADRLISKACPFAAAGIMVGSIYWTAVTYGAVTVMQDSKCDTNEPKLQG
ncbi:UNVERIFIED_CONTAM: hypothetical protein FKN15_050115 [Acipenser sinensis]